MVIGIHIRNKNNYAMYKWYIPKHVHLITYDIRNKPCANKVVKSKSNTKGVNC